MTSTHPAARPLLAAGVLAGLGLAIASVVGPGAAVRVVPRDAVALVNGEPIRREDFVRARTAVETDRKTALTPDDLHRLVDRLIDEELLLQRALALDLPRHDPRTRGDLVRAMIDLTVSEAGARVPSDADVEAFYAAHADYFAQPGRVRLRHLQARDADGAAAATARLRAGESFDAVRAALGRMDAVPVPDALLPPTKLREYVGEAVVMAALSLAPGATSEPIATPSAWHVVQMVEHEPDRVPPLDDVRDAVRAELQRRKGDEALLEHLARLRRMARITVGALDP